jgi:hypothetical protein
MAKIKCTKGQTTIYKTLQRKVKNEQHKKTPLKLGVNPGAPEGQTVSAPRVAPEKFQNPIENLWIHLAHIYICICVLGVVER